MGRLEQMVSGLEQSNRNSVDLKLWKEAKVLGDLGKIIRPTDDNSTATVYQSLLWFENQNSEKGLDGRTAQVLHGGAGLEVYQTRRFAAKQI